MPVVFCLRLEDDGSPEYNKKFLRLPPPPDSNPYILRFILVAGSVASKNAKLFINYPVNRSEFVRSEFQSISFVIDPITDATADLYIKTPGVFEYYVEYESWDTPAKKLRSATTGSFVVDPRLYIPAKVVNQKQDVLLPLDGISILTIIPKWMPTIDEWDPYFKAFAHSNYNMVHYAPVNQRGMSNSPYSIYDQLSLSDDLFKGEPTEEEKEVLMQAELDRIYKEYGIMHVTDVVWNHTACNSDWLQHHPEAGYNIKNSPHLRPAYEIDEAILQFSADIESVHKLPTTLRTEDDLKAAISVLKNKIIPDLKMWEFYVLEKDAATSSFLAKWPPSSSSSKYAGVKLNDLSPKDRALLFIKDAVVGGELWLRYGRKLNAEVAVDFIAKLLNERGQGYENGEKIFDEVLSLVNLLGYEECNGDMSSVVEQTTHRARYLRVAEHGAKLGPLTRENPIVDTYFTRLPKNEVTKDYHPDEMMLACNGWIWNADPLLNFAGPQSKAYLRREVIAWGDCVKLRYGDEPKDNPWLWEHQAKYTEKMARLFHGFRIDNCHSTPINVASYLLDVGRRVRPDLYVFAELFTGSEEKDRIFVAKMGLNSLIREGMNAWDSFELSRLVHRHGGEPVGSLTIPPEHFPLDMLGHFTGSVHFTPVSSSTQLLIDTRGSAPHTLFMDCTHDNETPFQKRTAEDTLPHAALVAMTNCAVGSVKGYDEVVPYLLNVVTETRKYRVPSNWDGIVPSRKTLNRLHSKMAREGYNEVHVHHEHDFISVHRIHPQTHDGYLLIARTAFNRNPSNEVHSPIHLRNQSVKLLECAALQIQVERPTRSRSVSQSYMDEVLTDVESKDEVPAHAAAVTNAMVTSQLYHHIEPESYENDEQVPQPTRRTSRRRASRARPTGMITGLPCVLDYDTDYTNFIRLLKFELNDGDYETMIEIDKDHFVPGSYVLVRTWVDGTGFEADGDRVVDPGNDISAESEVLKQLWQLLGLESGNTSIEIMLRMGWDVLGSGRVWISNENQNAWPPGLFVAVEKLGALELNAALFRADPEERDAIGDGVYEIPGYGALPYCGLQGIVSALQPIARVNDLGHPIFSNIRNGPWLYDYTTSRLFKYAQKYPALHPLHNWLKERLELVKKLSPSFTPKYFSTVIMLAYHALRYKALSVSGSSIIAKDVSKSRLSTVQSYSRALAMTSFQMYGEVPSTGLFPKKYPLLQQTEQSPSIAAGLTHFATNHMRCWGRDVFITLRGLYLLPGHFTAAKDHIIAFGSTLRHGLIPNLLDKGYKPRYNARDATWFWMYAVQEYCRMAPDGKEFLSTKVARRFPPLPRYRDATFLKVSETEPTGGEVADWYVDPEDELCYKYESTVAQLCQEIFDRHARGISFREWNAGPNLDHAMRNEGFEINVSVDFETGFVYGGNRYNCGTWMDKMGDSERAGIKGVPATPRDGSAIELNGLAKACLRWIVNDVQGKNAAWPWKGVELKDGRLVTYKEWNDLIQNNFEKYFYVSLDKSEDPKYQHKRPELINRRGIYKDTYGASLEYQDYQLRPNQFIAMVVAPELFDVDHAIGAVEIGKDALAAPLGIKTLDPTDWAYRGVYDNANDSADPTVARGINYHNGPEWVWVYSFFLRAYLHFEKKARKGNFDHAVANVSKLIMPHKLHILDTKVSPFAGLPELTNQNGAYCHDSCATQAWSSATMLELVDDIYSS